MTAETEKQLIDDVREIKDAIKGNDLTGQPGLAGRVTKIEKRQRKNDLRNAWAGGVVATVLVLIKWLFFEKH